MTANSFAYIETDKEAKVEVTNLMVEYKQVLYETLSSSSLRGGRSCSVWLRHSYQFFSCQMSNFLPEIPNCLHYCTKCYLCHKQIDSLCRGVLWIALKTKISNIK